MRIKTNSLIYNTVSNGLNKLDSTKENQCNISRDFSFISHAIHTSSSYDYGRNLIYAYVLYSS